MLNELNGSLKKIKYSERRFRIPEIDINQMNLSKTMGLRDVGLIPGLGRSPA